MALSTWHVAPWEPHLTILPNIWRWIKHKETEYLETTHHTQSWFISSSSHSYVIFGYISDITINKSKIWCVFIYIYIYIYIYWCITLSGVIPMSFLCLFPRSWLFLAAPASMGSCSSFSRAKWKRNSGSKAPSKWTCNSRRRGGKPSKKPSTLWRIWTWCVFVFCYGTQYNHIGKPFVNGNQ